MKRKNQATEGGAKNKKSKKSNFSNNKGKSNFANKNKGKPSHNKGKPNKKGKVQKRAKPAVKNEATKNKNNLAATNAKNDASTVKNDASKGKTPFAKKTFKKFSKEPRKANMDKKKLKKEQNKTENTTGEKPNWMEYKKEQKELREKRRARKFDKSYDVVVEAKQIGEKLRRSKLSPDMQEKLTKKLYDLLQSQYMKMINAHDLSRVIQWQIKYCSPDIQLAITEELKPHFHEMLFSKYAKNVIRTLVKRGSNDVKKSILNSCYGIVVKLLSSVISSSLFEKLYVEVASDSDKNLFKQEFYGDLYKKSKDPKIKTLPDAYKDSEGMKTATLSAVKANLVKILNKNLINSSLVHTVLFEYLSNCSKEDSAEIIALVRPIIAELSQTKDGAKAANLCIWHGTNKDRKLIMKSLKENVKDIMTSEHGHLMILALLDSVDDTVLMKKILLQEVLNNLDDIVSSEYGKRVILYIVARRDTCHFHPALVEYLKQGDGNEASKKPADIREKEILENLIDDLLQNMTNNVTTWLSNGPIQLVTLAVLKASPGDKAKEAFEAIAKFITDPDSKLQKDDKTFEAIEEPGLHMVLKKLIKIVTKRAQENQLTFGEVLCEQLSPEAITHWVKYNRGCFLLVNLIENESEQVVSQLKAKLQKMKKVITLQSKGATILLEKIK